MRFACILIIVVIGGCQSQDQKQLEALQKRVDSLTAETSKKSEPQPTPPIQPQNLTLYAFCVITYDYKYYDGPTYDRNPPKEHIERRLSVSQVENIDNNEDAKYMLGDRCLSKWENSKPVYEINHTTLINKEVFGYATYALASQARSKYLLQN